MAEQNIRVHGKEPLDWANTTAAGPIDWSAYASQYDVMCDNNSHYQENIEKLLQCLPGWNLPSGPVVCDVGAGTGNFFCQLAKRLPCAEFVHVDGNPEMNAAAMVKYRAGGVNVELVEEYVQRVNFPPESFDMMICVHALYAMAPQDLVLRRMYGWLKPGSRLFLVDLGRKMNPVDWGLHFLLMSIREGKFLSYLSNVINGREVLTQNRLTARGQQLGFYRMHETAEFGELLRAAGFIVEELVQCYRGYSDLAICRKPC